MLDALTVAFTASLTQSAYATKIIVPDMPSSLQVLPPLESLALSS